MWDFILYLGQSAVCLAALYLLYKATMSYETLHRLNRVVLLYDDPKPHFNTVSTMVRTLETKGFLDHEAFGNTYRYRPVVSQEEFSKGVLGNVVTRYFENSYKSVVSALIDEEKISIEDLEELIRRVNNQ